MKFIFLLFSFAIYTKSMAQNLEPIGSAVFHWNEIPVKKTDGREGRKIVQGTTYPFNTFSIHATTQLKGAVPRPPHTQKDMEELIIIKEGIMKCTIGTKTAILSAGSILLIPPMETQFFENAGDGPLTYYVLMFRSDSINNKRSLDAGGTIIINYDTLTYTEKGSKGTRKYFDRPTAMCNKYEMHTTHLKEKGPSHAPHEHIDTEIILVVEGQVAVTVEDKTLTGRNGDIFIIESMKKHSVINAGNSLCSYFAFKWR
jgi:quercetin dioxygenase-like cupin family protein